MKKIIFVLLSTFFFSSLSLAAMNAVTSTGKEVILNSDGTWHYRSPPPETEQAIEYLDSKVKIELISISIEEYESIQSFIKKLKKQQVSKEFQVVAKLKLTNITKNQIIKPITHKIWGYGKGEDRGGTYVSGFMLTDNFGNDLMVSQIEPSFVGYKEKGIRPGENIIFTLKTADYPIAAASNITLNIDRETLGNSQQILFEIPRTKLSGHKKYPS